MTVWHELYDTIKSIFTPYRKRTDYCIFKQIYVRAIEKKKLHNTLMSISQAMWKGLGLIYIYSRPRQSLANEAQSFQFHFKKFYKESLSYHINSRQHLCLVITPHGTIMPTLTM